jgi:hypothetical protein
LAVADRSADTKDDILKLAIACYKISDQFRLHRKDRNGGHGNAVSLPD